MPADAPERDAPADALLLEAGTWYARMREPLTHTGRRAERQAAFDRWLKADARHPKAYAETERLWHALAEPAARAAALDPANALEDPPRPRSLLLPVLAAAGVAALVAMGLLWQQPARVWLASDRMTAAGEQLPLTLDDGTRITLNTATAMALRHEPGARGVSLLRGEAWFDVTANAARPFTVETPMGTVRVTGTSFGVRLDANGATVSLTEGRVALIPGGAGGGNAVPLRAGEQARLRDGGVSAATPLDPAMATAWLRGQLVFYDTPLEDVVTELNRYFPGRIVVANPALKALRVSGVFHIRRPDEALAAITATIPVQVTRLTGYLVILR